MTLWRAEFFPRVLFFSNSVSLGVFSHSKGPGAGRSSPNPTAQGSQRFAGRGSQEDVSRRRFPGRGSQARFLRAGSQARFASKVPKQGSGRCLHQGCDTDLSREVLKFGVCDFPFHFFSKKCFKIVFSFGAAISSAVARRSLCFASQSLQIALQWLRQGCLASRLHA